MKKITIFMLAVTMSLMASAQFQLGHKLINRDAAFEYAKTHKATPYINSKSTTASASIVVNSNTGFTVNTTITPNADCIKYYAFAIDKGAVEAIAQLYGVSAPTVIATFGFQESGELTGIQTIDLGAIGSLTPNGVESQVYVAAVGATDTAVFTADFTTKYIGGTGTANITTTVSNITSNSADISFTKNDQTAYYYFYIGERSSMIQAGLLTPTDVATYLEQQYAAGETDIADRMYESVAGTVGGSENPLTAGTKYAVYAFAYNNNNVLGTYTAPIFFIPGVGIVGLNDVETLSSSVYPNPAKDQVTFTTSSKMNKVEIFNMVGQKVYENNVNGIATSVNVSNFNAGSYIAKIYTQSGVATQRLIVK